MADEETPLTSGRPLGSRKITFNLEKIRMFALLSVAVFLITGKAVSKFAVVIPTKSDPSTVWDKVFNGAPSDFIPEETFIYKLFGFNHNCTIVDFNPAKTISALIFVMFFTMPACFFVICHFLRITSHTEVCFKNLQRYSKIATPIEFTVFTYFCMVFVNSPVGEYGTPEGTLKFTLHYIPYVGWQLGLLLMAIQQSWYMYLRNRLPFSWVTKGVLLFNIKLMVVVFIVYTYFVCSFIIGSPAWDTFSEPGRTAGITLMYTWDVLAIVIPTLFAYSECKYGNDSEIIFNELLESDR